MDAKHGVVSLLLQAEVMKVKMKMKHGEEVRNQHTHRVMLGLGVIFFDNELIMMLAPGENVTPVREIIRNHGEAIAPCLNDGLHVMQTGVMANVAGLQALIDLSSLLQFHDLLGSLQQAHMDVGGHTGQTTPLLDGKVAGHFHQPFNLHVNTVKSLKELRE